MPTSPNPDETVYVFLEDIDGEPISDRFELMSEALDWLAIYHGDHDGPNYIIQRRRGCIVCAHSWGAPDNHPVHLEPCEPGCSDGWIPDDE